MGNWLLALWSRVSGPLRGALFPALWLAVGAGLSLFAPVLYQRLVPPAALDVPGQVSLTLSQPKVITASGASPVRWFSPDAALHLAERDPSSVWAWTSQRGSYRLYAYSAIRGQPTELAPITVQVGEAPTPGPGPGPAKSKLWVIVVTDGNQRTPAQAALLDSPTLWKAVSDAGDVKKLYDATGNAAELAAAKLQPWVQKAGGPPCLILEDSQGQVRAALPLPASETDFLAAVSKAGG